ncbi:MAG: hypothetical protein LAT75_06895 [Candidatus Cyclonatronum sp.]|uniref:hypothetical protein n=1 Tax=Cyclonatronum sp. TaxID=3024185 RepID=UPI0025BD9C2C|nr:hypothetical protein [Cyclonatronum sp.]MCC5933358.1 hypothetical protein [Balneolales bacterium]MCH8486575.1 hypothetical protein [Cyclonatronum sp.]
MYHFLISKNMNPGEKRGISIFKGVLERLFLITGILLGYPQVIIAFGALKIGTRFRNSEKGKVSDDYFLIGNLVSLLAVMLFIWVLGFF